MDQGWYHGRSICDLHPSLNGAHLVEMKQLGKIGRIIDGRLVIVAHVLEKGIQAVEPYKLSPKKCPGLISFLTDG